MRQDGMRSDPNRCFGCGKYPRLVEPGILQDHKHFAWNQLGLAS
jgi:hypothetical protein